MLGQPHSLHQQQRWHQHQCPAGPASSACTAGHGAPAVAAGCMRCVSHVRVHSVMRPSSTHVQDACRMHTRQAAASTCWWCSRAGHMCCGTPQEKPACCRSTSPAALISPPAPHLHLLRQPMGRPPCCPVKEACRCKVHSKGQDKLRL